MWSALSTPISDLRNGDPRAAGRAFPKACIRWSAAQTARRGAATVICRRTSPRTSGDARPVAQDRDAFYAAEIEVREKTGYPPFGRLASLLYSRRTTYTSPRIQTREKSQQVPPIHDHVRVLGSHRSTTRGGARALPLPHFR